MINLKTKFKNQRGFAVVDALLAVAILAAIILGLSKLQIKNNEDLKAKQVSDSMTKATEIFTKYLISFKGDDAAPKIIKALEDGSGASSWCVINANISTGAGTVANNVALHTCAVDLSFLKYKKLVPQNYPESNAFGQRWTAIYRLVYEDFDNNSATPATTNGSIEMLIVGATNGGNERSMTTSSAILAATISGFSGGYIPSGQWGSCQYNSTKKQACGSGGSWSVELNKFVNNP